LKRKADGLVDRHKACLVAKGFHQQLGIDYGETYSPVIKPTTVRLILSLAISSGWPIHQIDIQNTFLHGNLSKDVYMAQPPGFACPQFPNHTCKLQKALYGLKQAPRAWYSRLCNTLIQLGFTISRLDSSLFILQMDSYTLLVLIYVDDILITCSNHAAIRDLLATLHRDFAVKDFRGVLLSQQRYILDILKRTKIIEAKPATSPMASSTHLSAFEGDLFNDPTLYRSTVGALHYLCITRPNISFSVNKLS